MKKIIIIFGIVSVIFLVFYIKQKNNQKNELIQEMRYEEVRRDEIAVGVSAVGIVKAKLSADISPETEQRGAKIVKLNIEEGDYVRKGDIVAELDKSALSAMLEAQEATLNSAKAQLELLLEGTRKEDIEKAEANLTSAKNRYLEAIQNEKRTRELYEKGFVSEKEKESATVNLNIAESDLKHAEAQLNLLKAGAREKEIEIQMAKIKQAEANYRQAKANYDNATIYAPISGTVISKLMEEGQVVYPNSIIAKIADLNTLQVIADVDETDIGKIKRGDMCEITFEALPDLKLNGSVLKISHEAKIKSDITYFEVTIGLEKKDNRLRPGMTADVDIILEKSPSTLVVSSSAVKMGRDGNYIVLAREKNKLVPRKVIVGIKTQDKYEILNGLNEGDVVVKNFALLRERKERPKGLFGDFGRPPGVRRGPGERMRTP